MNDAGAIIARLEKATGPDREIDAIIYAQFGEPPDLGFPVTMWAAGENVFWKGGTVTQGPVLFLGGDKYPRFTASIDAALKLMPDGPGWTFCIWQDHRGNCAQVRRPSPIDRGIVPQITKHAATPAIALCIASLKARSAVLTQPTDRSASE